MRALLLILLFSLGAVARAQPSVSDYAQLPQVTAAAISPNGEKLVLAWSLQDRTGYGIVDIATLDESNIRYMPNTISLRGVGWIDDQRIDLTLSTTIQRRDLPFPTPPTLSWRGELWRSATQRLDAAEATILGDARIVNVLNGDSTELIAPIADDPGFGRMIVDSIQDGRMSVYRIDLDGRAATRIGYGRARTYDLMVDGAGAIRARLDFVENRDVWQLFDLSDGREVLRAEGPVGVQGAPFFAGEMADGRIALLYNPPGDAARALGALNADGSIETIFAAPGYDLNSAILDPWTHRVVGARWVADQPTFHFFEADLADAQAHLDAAFRGGYAEIISWSTDRTRLLVYAERVTDAGAYYLFDRRTQQIVEVAREHPQLTGAALGRRQAITYRARDGATIPAYLTTPADVEARNLPLIVIVHGGPHARSDFTFDHWASFLASRGYAVLEPNFRGSIGFGEAWFEAGRGQWGDGIMQTDVDDGLAALTRSGIAAPNRACILGGSYGGYAALAAATLTPTLFRCAISIGGISDLMDLFQGASARETKLLGFGEHPDRFRVHALSPIDHVSAVQAPILLIHGVDDSVVPIDQSRDMLQALQRAQKDVTMVELPADDHWLSTSRGRTQTLEAIDAFLARVLPAHPASP